MEPIVAWSGSPDSDLGVIAAGDQQKVIDGVPYHAVCRFFMPFQFHDFLCDPVPNTKTAVLGPGDHEMVSSKKVILYIVIVDQRRV